MKLRALDAIVIVAVLIALVGLVVYTADAAVDSTCSFSADGLVNSQSSMSGSQCGLISSQTTDVFGKANVGYNYSTDGTQSTSALTANAGKVGFRNSMFTMTWEQPKQICNGGSCGTTGGFYTQMAAETNAYLTDAGNVKTVATPNTYSVDATGTGSIARKIGVIDMKGNTNDGTVTNTCNMISDFEYSERTSIIGKYTLASKFVFTR